MKNRITTGILFFLFLLTASGVFAAMVENSRQGLVAISVTSHPAFSLESSEQRQGLTRILLELVSGGAFISKDPIGFNGGMNLYRYADNNPMLFSDPWGLYPYVLLVLDSDTAINKRAEGVIKNPDFKAGNSVQLWLMGGHMLPNKWFPDTPHLYKFSDYSSFEKLWEKVYDDAIGDPIQRMIIYTHGKTPSGLLQFSLDPKVWITSENFMKLEDCRDPKRMFDSTAEIYFFSCFTGNSDIPKTLLETYLTKGAVYSTTKTANLNNLHPDCAKIGQYGFSILKK